MGILQIIIKLIDARDVLLRAINLVELRGRARRTDTEYRLMCLAVNVLRRLISIIVLQRRFHNETINGDTARNKTAQ